MSDVKTEKTEGKPVEPIALLDCGEASKVTKGLPYFLMHELSPPPWDTTLTG